jgi:hypothetical protein
MVLSNTSKIFVALASTLNIAKPLRKTWKNALDWDGQVCCCALDDIGIVSIYRTTKIQILICCEY